MNYQKIYNQIIERAKTRNLENYKEKHHIIPKCLGGNNKKENIVELTAREHFLCHWLLYRIHPNHKGVCYSFWMMSNGCYNKNHQERFTPSSRIYNEAREVFSKLHRITQKGKNPFKNKTLKEKEIINNKISKSKKGQIPYIKGKNHSNEAKEKIRQGLLGQKQSEETCLKKSKSLLGQKKSKIHIKNISKAKIGKGNHMYGIKGKNNRRSKPVIQYDKHGNFIQYWENGLIASKKLKINYQSLNNCLLEKIKTSGGFVWEYK